MESSWRSFWAGLAWKTCWNDQMKCWVCQTVSVIPDHMTGKQLLPPDPKHLGELYEKSPQSNQVYPILFQFDFSHYLCCWMNPLRQQTVLWQVSRLLHGRRQGACRRFSRGSARSAGRSNSFRRFLWFDLVERTLPRAHHLQCEALYGSWIGRGWSNTASVLRQFSLLVFEEIRIVRIIHGAYMTIGFQEAPSENRL